MAVRDRGVGIDPVRRAAREASDGLGLRLIHALAERVEVRLAAGTELRMIFTTPQLYPIASVRGSEALRFSELARRKLGSTAALEATPPALARALMPRLLALLAAQAQFSVVGIQELGQLAESLIRGMFQGLPTEAWVGASATTAPGELVMYIGPVACGSAASSIASVELEGRSLLATPLLDSPNGRPSASELLALRVEQR